MNTPLDEPAEPDIPPEARERYHKTPTDSPPADAAKSDDPDRSPPRDTCDTGGFSSAGQRQVLTADRH